MEAETHATGEEQASSAPIPTAKEALAVEEARVLNPQKQWLAFVFIAASMNAAVLACDSPFEGLCALIASTCLGFCVHAWLARDAAKASCVQELRCELGRVHAAAQTERTLAQRELAHAQGTILEMAHERDVRIADLATEAEERSRLEAEVADKCVPLRATRSASGMPHASARPPRSVPHPHAPMSIGGLLLATPVACRAQKMKQRHRRGTPTRCPPRRPCPSFLDLSPPPACLRACRCQRPQSPVPAPPLQD